MDKKQDVLGQLPNVHLCNVIQNDGVWNFWGTTRQKLTKGEILEVRKRW